MPRLWAWWRAAERHDARYRVRLAGLAVILAAVLLLGSSSTIGLAALYVGAVVFLVGWLGNVRFRTVLAVVALYTTAGFLVWSGVTIWAVLAGIVLAVFGWSWWRVKRASR